MNRRLIAMMLSFSLLSAFLCSCNLFSTPLSDEEMIENRIDQFLRCYNTGDLEGILKCLDVKTRKGIESAINISEGLAGMLGVGGISFSDLFGYGVGISESDELLGVEIYSMEIDEKSADVIVKMSYALTDNAKHEENALFEMRKENGDWFIHDFRSYYGNLGSD